MSNTYAWSVLGMSAYPEYESQTDVVFLVSYQCTATSSTINPKTNTPYQSSNGGSVSVSYTAGSPYTPYSQLTQSQVIGWVQAALGAEGVAQIEAACDSGISSQIAPPIVNPPLPWQTPAA